MPNPKRFISSLLTVHALLAAAAISQPTVTSTVPSQHQVNVPPRLTITALFDQDMSAASLTNSTVLVDGTISGPHDGTINYHPESRTLAFVPELPFSLGEVVNVTISSGAQSASGQPLIHGATWTFNILTYGGDGIFAGFTAFPTQPRPYGVCAADLDGDARPELTCANEDNTSASVFRQAESGDFQLIGTYSTRQSPIAVVSCDFDRNGISDLLTANWDGSSVSILPGNGDGTFAAQQSFAATHPFWVCAGDFDGDGYFDAATAMRASSIGVLRNDGHGAFEEEQLWAGSNNAYGIVAADFDNDFDLDIACANLNSPNVTIFFNNGLSEFSNTATYPVGEGPISVVASDLNDDGTADLAVANWGSNSLTILANNGGGVFSVASTKSVGIQPHCVIAEDFTGDGLVDLVTVNRATHNVSVLLNRGGFDFGPASSYTVGNSPRSACAVDVDGDGDADLVVSSGTDMTIGVLYNQGAGLPIRAFEIANESTALNVVTHQPQFVWSYMMFGGLVQEAFEVEVGSDVNWSIAELWDPDPFLGGDTAVQYDGSPLEDGMTYYLRLRLFDGESWRGWYQTSFHMNSLPGPSSAAAPLNGASVGPLPTLCVTNATDAEGDPLSYQFEVFLDPENPVPVAASGLVSQTADSTGWTVSSWLTENQIYFWRARAWDGYEYGNWLMYWFVVDGTPEPPGTAMTIAPIGENLIVYDMLPTFVWSNVTDPDPLDEVKYRLELSLNQNFTLVVPFDNLADTAYHFTDSLAFATRYWWRVKALDNGGLFSTSAPSDFWTWALGDVNRSHDCTIGDVSILIDHLFITGTTFEPLKAGDVNGSCDVSIGDVSMMIDHLFISGTQFLVGCE